MRISLFLVLISGILALDATLASTAPPAVCSDKINSIPDLTQTDPKARFPHGGIHYCGPTAVSNSLMWLAQNGYDKLMPPSAGRNESQAEMAMLLASEKYMNTTLEHGTSPTDILIGISRYLRDCGYRYKELEYQGWRRHPRKFTTGIAVPQLDWIKKSLIGPSAVWLNVGWYEHSSEENSYSRIGGHWVTLAGFGVDANGREDPSILIIHDPSPQRGKPYANEYVRVERIDTEGMIISGEKSTQAKGFFKLTDGLRKKRSADCAILDGAISLRM